MDTAAVNTPRLRGFARDHLALIPVVMAFGLVMFARTWGVWRGDLLMYDEGWQMAQGKALVSALAHPADGNIMLSVPRDGKLMHDLLVGALSAIGVGPFTMIWLSVLSGAVMVSTVARCAWKSIGPSGAPIATLIVGLTPISLIYGHRLLSDTLAVAVLSCTLLAMHGVLDRGADRGVATALSLSVVMVSVNYRYVSLAIPFFIVVVFRARLRRMPDGRLVTFVALLLPGVAIVFAYVALHVTHGILPARLNLYELTDKAQPSPWPFVNGDFYLRLFAEPGYIAIDVLVLLGLVATWRDRRCLTLFDVTVAGALVGQLLLDLALTAKAPRVATAVIPLAAIVSARSVNLFLPSARRSVGVLAACLAVVPTALVGVSAASAPGGMMPLASWLREHPGRGAFVKTCGNSSRQVV